MLNNTGALKQEDKGSRATVHDGDFRGGHIHIRIINTQACHGREQVFDRGDAGFSMNETSRQRRLTDQVSSSGDLGCGFRSVRRNTIPVSTGAGDSVSNTFSPVCKPTPVALIEFRNVRCRIILLPF